jgi:hypothetical protein
LKLFYFQGSFFKMSHFVKLKIFSQHIITFIGFKRYAGHSKWANIKRTKMQTDHKKSILTQVIIKKLQLAVDSNMLIVMPYHD